MAEMSNEEIVNEFNDLFATDEPTEDDKTETEPETPDEEENSSEDEESTETGEDKSEDEGDDSKTEEKTDTEEDKKQAQQNYKFAEMRTTIKNQENLLRNLGKAIGLDNNASVEEVAAKINEVLITKQSKETGVPVELLQRLQTLEARDADYQFAERQSKTKDAITGLIEKYSLSDDDTEAFMQQLIANGKNPLEVDGVDIEAEYIRNNFDNIIKNAVDNALNDERARRTKAESKSSSSVGGNSSEGGSDKKINSVSALDSFFDGLEL